VILDAHHHLWDPARVAYPWMTGDFAPLAVRHDAAEHRETAAPLGVTASVAVQAAHDVTETRDLLAASAQPDALVCGVVGWVDLTAPDVSDRIAAHREAPGGDALVGIRHQVHDEPDDEWLLRDDVKRGLRDVAAAGLTFDLLLFPQHLPVGSRLARAIPELPLVVDHGAKPRIAAGETEPWATDLARLAEANPRVHCKLSGLVTEADWATWPEQDVGAYARRILDAFGAERTMFGSDWPVCTLVASYAEVLETATGALHERERNAVLHDTATRFYGLAAARSIHDSTPDR
jgi:L-fucono-1,5-lactonase